jgi:hypothetical protein
MLTPNFSGAGLNFRANKRIYKERQTHLIRKSGIFDGRRLRAAFDVRESPALSQRRLFLFGVFEHGLMLSGDGNGWAALFFFLPFPSPPPPAQFSQIREATMAPHSRAEADLIDGLW